MKHELAPYAGLCELKKQKRDGSLNKQRHGEVTEVHVPNIIIDTIDVLDLSR